LTQEHAITSIFAKRIGQGQAHTHGTEELVGKTGLFGLPLWLGNWALVLLWIVPMWWYYINKRKMQSVK